MTGSAKIVDAGRGGHRFATRYRGLVLSAPFVLLCIAGLALLSLDAARHIQALATANSDSSQWSLAQFEVEFSGLQNLLDTAPEEADLDAVRLGFDIFYSRFLTVSRGKNYQDIAATARSHAALQRIGDFLDRTTPLIDGEDAVLRAALLDLSKDSDAVRGDIRQVSLDGVRVFSAQADAQRRAVMNALIRLTILAAALVLALAIGVVALWRLMHLARDQARHRARANHRLQAVVSTAGDGIVVTDALGRILDFNASASRIFGISRTDALNEHADRLLLAPDAPEANPDALLGCAGRGRIRTEGRRADGACFAAELAVTRSEEKGNLLHVIYMRDITETVAAEAELVAARDQAVAGERAKASFLAVMSHEMRTPLNGLIGALELLDDTDLSPTQRDYLRILRRSGDILLTHVNDVLDISRLETGKFAFAREPFDPAELVTELVEGQLPSAVARGSALAADLAGRLPPAVLGDRTRVRQVLVNLLGNAIKFTERGEIRVGLAYDRGAERLNIFVSDTGIGIAREKLDEIFEDFVTLDSAYMRAAEGTGLGLGIARRLAEGMGGTIRVDSTPGRGSTFSLSLPAAPVELPVPQAVPPEQADSPPRDILLVEDNPVNRLVATAMLRKLGHRVVEAADGQEGLKRAGARRFDLILMDISMPSLDGVETTLRIRAREGPNVRTPIVALTAHALPDDLARFREAGMTDALTKPITRRALAMLLGGMTTADAPETAGTPEETTEERRETLLDGDLLHSAVTALGDEEFAALRDRFVKETDDGLSALAAGLEEGLDSGRYAAEIHRLAGSAAVFGAAALHAALQAQEDRARSGGPLREAHEDLLPIWKQTRRALGRLQL